MKRQIQRRRPEQRCSTEKRSGAAMVEFAIIAPVFLTLILGAMEGGKALETSNLMSAAVREGGRLAAMDWEDVVPDGTTANDKITSDIRNFLTAAGMPGDQVGITITSAEGDDIGQTFDLADTDNRLRLFKITATVPYSSVSAYPAHFMDGHSVNASIVMRAGRVTLLD